AGKERDRARAAREALRRTLYGATLNLAQAAWERDDFGRVQELLQEARPGPGEEDLRGFEWHYWDRLCHADLRSLTLAGPRNLVLPPGGGTVLSPRGDLLAALVGWASKEAAVKVWDTADGKELFAAPVRQHAAACLAFGPDGRRFALIELTSAGQGNKPPQGRLVLWDAATGKELLSLSGPFRTELAVWPDGRGGAGAGGHGAHGPPGRPRGPVVGR